MKSKFKKSIIIAALLLTAIPGLALAHQPRITENRETIVTEPEISKAYYAKLQGEPDTYRIKADSTFNLYVNILVPAIDTQKDEQNKEVSAEIFKNGTKIATLNGQNFEWKKFYEPFGADTYWMGPEYKTTAEAGNYEIRVSSPKNNVTYSLATGEVEAFNFKETINSLKLIPQIKQTFFQTSPISFIMSPLGLGMIFALYLLAGIFGLIYRALLKYFAKNKNRRAQKNINIGGRLFRAALGAALLIWAIFTSWSPILIFFSGFTFFEAIFSWCGFYAAIGKNSCPL